jgi:hypothetical protein
MQILSFHFTIQCAVRIPEDNQKEQEFHVCVSVLTLKCGMFGFHDTVESDSLVLVL